MGFTMSSVKISTNYFNDPNDTETLTKVEALINTVFKNLQGDFFEGELKRVTLDELRFYSQPENPDKQRLVISTLSDGQIVGACVLVQWMSNDKKYAGMNAVAADPN